MVFTGLLQTVFAQSVGTWHSYAAYYNTTMVAEGNNYVFAVADGSLYSYGKEDNSLNYYATETGLSDNQIKSIAFNADENTLVIAYINGNIDLAGEEKMTVYNLPFLMNSSNIQDKTINDIFCYKEMAYLSTNFGVIALNLKKKEIKETYILNVAITSLTIYNDDIYAVSSNGIMKASLKDNLINPANWHYYTVDISPVQQICTFQNSLCFLVNGKGIYYQTGDQPVQQLINAQYLKRIKIENEKLITFSGSELFIYSSLTERERGLINNISDVSSLKDKNTFWLATGTEGLTGIRRTAANQYQTIVNNLANDGPKRNLDAFLMMQENKLYIAGGGRWTDRFRNTGTVMIYDTETRKWNNLKDVNGFIDATCIAVFPNDTSHYFVSTWGEGVYEFKNGEQIQLYNHLNSGLSAIPGTNPPANYVRVEGVCFDKQHNLWMTNSEVSNVIVVLKADGTWAKLYYDEISNPTLADKILIASSGDKWVNLVRGNQSGIFVFNDKGTIDDTSDDASYFYSYLSDNQGNIGATEYLCISEDKNKEIWIGTNRGVAIISVPSRGVQGTMSCSRIIIKDSNGNNDYFLKDERINAIAVDGGNRKWLGTENSGLYLVSENGKEVIEHFTVENSPIISNTIQSLTINDITGEVFIGTNKGLISYIGDATKGSENYSNVFAYPNPVRPDFDDKVIVTGLMENSNIKITDSRGNLIVQGKSTGGQFSWNCRNVSGKKVVSGVYLVLSSTPNAKESVVTKIAVVR
ncbi:ABC transporter substrate-binding protein [Bacteroidia bacterium]|nr:ABC transporter substrate-binding protein [Bacteroidia bacterium]